jgi:poly[(R)-3-hydroxyalkanoate] polymerase subunit PhaC
MPDIGGLVPSAVPDVGAVVGALRRDVARSVFRTRNGLKHVAGINRTRVGTTPKDVVWRSGKAELWRYRSDSIRHSTPVVIVYSIISRSYLFDLYPGHSFVERLRDEGFDVYLLDWGVADERDAGYGLDVYVLDRIPAALRAACAASGAETVTLFGYCFGGTLSLLALACTPDLPVRNVIELATPVDFSKFGLFSELIGPAGRLDPRELLDLTGNLPAEASRDIFRVLKPTSRIAAYVNLYDNLWNDEFMTGYEAMGQWTRDNIPFPGQAFLDTVELLFKRNGIVNGTLHLRGQPADTRAIDCPLLVVTAQHDHIVPSRVSGAIHYVVGSDEIESAELPFGHVGLIVGRAAARKTIPHIVDWLRRQAGDRIEART